MSDDPWALENAYCAIVERHGFAGISELSMLELVEEHIDPAWLDRALATWREANPKRDPIMEAWFGPAETEPEPPPELGTVLGPVRRSKRLPVPYTADELERLYGAARPEVRAVMRLLHETGMRSAEVLTLTCDQARSWPAPLRWRAERWWKSPTVRIIGKGNKERVVVLTAEAVKAAHVLLEAGAHPREQLVPWSDRGLRYVIAEAGKLAGVHAHPHRFRHTAITEWVESGTPIDVVADMAGHSKVDITRIYYAASVAARERANLRRRKYLRRR